MTTDRNMDARTVEGFGDEWRRFDQSGLSDDERRALFERYFSCFPWASLPEDARGVRRGLRQRALGGRRGTEGRAADMPRCKPGSPGGGPTGTRGQAELRVRSCVGGRPPDGPGVHGLRVLARSPASRSRHGRRHQGVREQAQAGSAASTLYILRVRQPAPVVQVDLEAERFAEERNLEPAHGASLLRHPANRPVRVLAARPPPPWCSSHSESTLITCRCLSIAGRASTPCVLTRWTASGRGSNNGSPPGRLNR